MVWCAGARGSTADVVVGLKGGEGGEWLHLAEPHAAVALLFFLFLSRSLSPSPQSELGSVYPLLPPFAGAPRARLKATGNAIGGGERREEEEGREGGRRRRRRDAEACAVCEWREARRRE
eukprot:1886433-Rhodomonas_salina.1